MNSLERVMATLQGQLTDRRAVSLTLSLYGARLTGCPLSRYYADPEAYALGQSAVRAMFKPDILFAPFAIATMGAAFGGRVRFYADQPPNLTRPALASAAEIDRLKVPDLDGNPILRFFEEAVRLMVAEHGHEVPVAAIALSPIDLPAMIFGLEGWLEIQLFDEQSAQRVMDATMPFAVAWINRLLAAGAAFAVLPALFANPTIVTRDMAVLLGGPLLQQALTMVEGPVVIHSGGAPLLPFIELYATLPNVGAFVVNTGESLSEARKWVGDQPTLIGNIAGPELCMRSVDDIQAECLALLRDRKDDPRVILGTSAADIAYATQPEQIQIVRQTAQAFARGELE